MVTKFYEPSPVDDSSGADKVLFPDAHTEAEGIFTVAISHIGVLKHFLTIELFKLVIVVKAELRVLVNGIMIHKGRRKVEKVKRE